ncbi:LysM peptidoglycan-binding domain-containing protein [Solidesulfovibrio sp.]
MPLTRLVVFLVWLSWLLPALLPAAATAPSAPQPDSLDAGYKPYTIQAGDTLTAIARKFGLTPEAVARANAIEQPHRIAAGNVLRLPVSRPETAPAAAEAAKPVPAMAQTPPPAIPVAAAAAAKAPAQASAAPTAPPAPQAAPAAEPRTPAAGPDSPARLAAGTYANPVLGTLRVNQTPTGINVTRDNQTIAMRHLLYGVFDGSDHAGSIHSLRLEYDRAGQVTALLYNAGNAKDIPFNRVNK